MRMTGPFTSQLPLLIGIEILTIIAFVLSLLSIFAEDTDSGQYAIINFNTTSIRGALPHAQLTGIADWYEVNYLSACSGMWSTITGNKDRSTTICIHEKAGYTFSLAHELGNDAAQLFPENSSYGTIHTDGTLLTVGITFTGIVLTSLFYGVAALLATGTPPLYVLRIGYLASIPAVIILTISSARITSIADKMTGTTEISSGVLVHAWMGWQLYVSLWLSATFMWAALGFSIVGAFKIASALEVEKCRSRGTV